MKPHGVMLARVMENLKDTDRILDYMHVDAFFTQAASVADNVTLLLLASEAEFRFTKNHFSPISGKSRVNEYSAVQNPSMASKFVTLYRITKIQRRKCEL